MMSRGAGAGSSESSGVEIEGDQRLGEEIRTFFSFGTADTEFGERLVNSLLTLGLVVGVSVGDTTLGTTVANLSFDETTFPVPVFIGDTLRFETEVVAARASGSRPDAGIVTFEHRAHNTRDQLVCRSLRNALMRRRPI